MDGRVLIEGGGVLALDEGAVIEAARRRAPEILDKTKLGAVTAPKWPVM